MKTKPIPRCLTLNSRSITCGNRARFKFRSSTLQQRAQPVCGTHLRSWLRVYPNGIVTAAGAAR